MATKRNIFMVAIILIALTGIFLFAGNFSSVGQARQQGGAALIPPQEQQVNRQLQPVSEPASFWLSKYEGQLVRTTFATTPPDLDKIFTTRLVKAEQTGIVLIFGNRRTVFFPYSNIISVEPM
jgi:hypothetical protein